MIDGASLFNAMFAALCADNLPAYCAGAGAGSATSHSFDQCSPSSGPIVMTWSVLWSRNAFGSHPGTGLFAATAPPIRAIQKTADATTTLIFVLIFISLHPQPAGQKR